MSPPRPIPSEVIQQIRNSEDADFLPIWEQCHQYTMTSMERGLALFRSVRHVVEEGIPGSIVECGVWRGGSIMIALLTLRTLNARRDIFLFDTFSGMTQPSDKDIDYQGRSAEDLMNEGRTPDGVWAIATGAEVRQNLKSLSIDLRGVHYINGNVCDTVGVTDTGPIALLRLDTDFYDSTTAELECLYPRVSPGGIVIIDDYGHWQGARKAVDEYFDKPGMERPFLNRIDYTGRLFVKARDAQLAMHERYDYVPPGLENPELIGEFSSAIVEDPNRSRWPYLRRGVPHKWRVDNRSTVANIGLISLEEAVLLYNLARPFSGTRGLEIGCHLGWSSAHLLKAGIRLDIIDPRLEPDQHGRFVTQSLEKAVPGSKYKLWSGYSPSIVPAVAATSDEPWSFAFIDGNHDGDAPARDSAAVIEHCAETACVVFHDLVAPAVAAGLTYFRDAGWNIRIYNTMQVLGVAWRGDYEPIQHIADPLVPVPWLPGLDEPQA